MEKITTPQIKAARMLVGINQGDIAERLGVGRSMIANVEIDRRHTAGVRARMIGFLEGLGVEFIEDGVRFRAR